MEQQLQKLTQAILARGELLKQLQMQCAAIQASVEEMKPIRPEVKTGTKPAASVVADPLLRAEAPHSSTADQHLGPSGRQDKVTPLVVVKADLQRLVLPIRDSPQSITTPAQASSPRSFATGELDNLMPAKCSMIGSDDDTASLTSAFMSDAVSGSPSTTTLLDVAITSPELTVATIRVRNDTSDLTAHQLLDEMPPLAQVDSTAWLRLSARPTFLFASTGVCYLVTDISHGVMVGVFPGDAVAGSGHVTLLSMDQGDELACAQVLCPPDDHKVWWPPPMKWDERQLWPPPSRVEIKCSGEELQPTPWPPPEQDRAMGSAVQRSTPWPSLKCYWNVTPPDWQDFVGSITLLVINSTISFIEENNVGNAAAALMAGFAPKAKVLRNGRWTEEEVFYLPGSYTHTDWQSKEIWAKVNSLTSIKTELPFSYYSLPYCRPQGGIKKSAENLGKLLMGNQIDNSPYRFCVNVNKSLDLCTTSPLVEGEVKLLQQRSRHLYQVNMILDNLPAKWFTEKNGLTIQWTGYPVGYTPEGSSEVYIINHLKFKVLVHRYEGGKVMVVGTGEGMEVISETDTDSNSGYEIVGFEVVPCSVKRDPETMSKLTMYEKVDPVNCPVELEKSQLIREKEQITFTYEVEFVNSDIRWPSRWDAYLKMEGAKIHWFSIMNSLMVILFLAGIVFVIFLRTVRRDLTRYEELDKEAQAQMNEELSGWKLVVGDVFREPTSSKLLCVMIGDGVQILGMAIVTIFFAAFGFMSPASRGMLLTGMIFLYMLLGIVAGYAAVRFWRTVKGTSEGWRSLSWSTACFFPGIVFIVLTVLNFMLWARNSTGTLPISLFFILLSLWFCISVPLTLLGGFFGTRAEPIEFPVRTNQIPREIPAKNYSWLLVFGAGTLPFGTLFIELFFILSSIWLGRFYYVFGFLLVVLLLLVVVCAEVSVVLTYMHLCAEDWRWWWKAFFASGTVAFYVFLYSINYLVFDLRSLSGPVSAALYIGYSFIVSLAIMLATGTVGFLTSFSFVHYLFSSVKID